MGYTISDTNNIEQITTNLAELPEDTYLLYGAAAIESWLVEEKQKYWTHFVKNGADTLLFAELRGCLTDAQWEIINTLKDRVVAVKQILQICKERKESLEKLHSALQNLSVRPNGVPDQLKFFFSTLAEQYTHNFLDAALRHDQNIHFRPQKEHRFKTVEALQKFQNDEHKKRTAEVAPRQEANQSNTENVRYKSLRFPIGDHLV